MNIIGRLEEHTYVFYENERKIYSIDVLSQKGLIRFQLKNQLNYDIYEIFQLANWKDRFLKKKFDFAIYEGDEKIAEFITLKDGFEIEIHGITKHIQITTKEGSPCVVIQHHHEDEVVYLFQNDINIQLKHHNDHALHICFAYILKQYFI